VDVEARVVDALFDGARLSLAGVGLAAAAVALSADTR
jgi:hypothetical protein